MVDEESWCTDRKRLPTSKKGKRKPKTKRMPSQVRNEDQSFSGVLRDYLSCEQREPTEDSLRDDKPDKIETHRMMMENPEEPMDELVTQNYYACEVKTEERVKSSMVKLANYTLDENQILKRYLTPETETNNSAMLFLAGTLLSSNRRVFEFLHEQGFFRPSCQNAVNTLASDFISHGQQLRDVLLRAERSSGEAVKNLVVSSVNNFVSTSNRLAIVLEQDIAAKSAAIGSARNNVLNQIIATRNQISDSLYKFFQKSVQCHNSSSITSGKRDRGGEVARFLADAGEFTNFLYSGLNKDKLVRSPRIEPVRKIGKDTHIKAPAARKTTPNIKVKNLEPNRDAAFQSGKKDSINDASDVLSTASSFLDFLNGASLSAMFDEEEHESDLPEAHLDAIFERINISVPRAKAEVDDRSTNVLPGTEWGDTSQTKPTKLTAREKRRLYIMARSQARQERKQKNLEKKKARAKDQAENKDKWSKMSIGRKNRKNCRVEV